MINHEALLNPRKTPKYFELTATTRIEPHENKNNPPGAGAGATSPARVLPVPAPAPAPVPVNYLGGFRSRGAWRVVVGRGL
jgi:hypothetical protein